MATLSALREGLKARLATITGLHAYDVMPGNINPPAAIVRPLSGIYRGSLGGSPRTMCELLILVAMPAIDKAQDALDPYLSEAGASSIFAALEGDRTLGGVADTLLCGGWRDYGSIVVNGQEFLAARLDVEVFH